MNVVEINPGSPPNHETLASYVKSTVILTLITTWVVFALQKHSTVHSGRNHIAQRIAWPVLYGRDLVKRMREAVQERHRQQ